jgi:hypothetical protein
VNIYFSFFHYRYQEEMSVEIKFGTDGWRGVIARDFTFDNLSLVAQATMDYMKLEGVAARVGDRLRSALPSGSSPNGWRRWRGNASGLDGQLAPTPLFPGGARTQGGAA